MFGNGPIHVKLIKNKAKKKRNQNQKRNWLSDRTGQQSDWLVNGLRAGKNRTTRDSLLIDQSEKSETVTSELEWTN